MAAAFSSACALCEDREGWGGTRCVGECLVMAIWVTLCSLSYRVTLEVSQNNTVPDKVVKGMSDGTVCPWRCMCFPGLYNHGSAIQSRSPVLTLIGSLSVQRQGTLRRSQFSNNLCPHPHPQWVTLSLKYPERASTSVGQAGCNLPDCLASLVLNGYREKRKWPKLRGVVRMM